MKGNRLIAPGTDGFRDRVFTVIFEHRTAAGRNFDIALMVAIFASMVAVMLESVASIRELYGFELRVAEWFFTILFAIEYVLRLVAVSRPLRYATSFFGVIDLLAVLPAFVALIFPGSQALSVVRGLRLLRAFRILKLARFVHEADTLLDALNASKPKILVFLGSVVTIVSILASVMYVVEGEEAGFTSIPRSMYWAIVTLTTVGYGDIAPKTVLGQTIAALVMVLGYAIIAVPTGIVSVNLSEASRRQRLQNWVPPEGCTGRCDGRHDADAAFCKHCGVELIR